MPRTPKKPVIKIVLTAYVFGYDGDFEKDCTTYPEAEEFIREKLEGGLGYKGVIDKEFRVDDKRKTRA